MAADNREELKGDIFQEEHHIAKDQANIEEGEVDQATRHLFQEYMIRARNKKTIHADSRNLLINNLHWRYKVDIHELSDMYKLKLRTIKEIIKQLGCLH